MKSTLGLKTYSQDYVIYQGTDVGNIVTGWTASTITSTSYVCYKLLGDMLFLSYFIQGTSNSTTVRIDLYPYTNKIIKHPLTTTGFTGVSALGRGSNNGGAYIANEISIDAALSLNYVNVYNGGATTVWTASGTKTVSGETMLPVNL